MVMFSYARYSQAGRATTDSLSCFLFGVLIFEIKKSIIVLSHKYPDKMAKYYTLSIFSNGFDHANLVTSFRGSKYLRKI